MFHKLFFIAKYCMSYPEVSKLEIGGTVYIYTSVCEGLISSRDVMSTEDEYCSILMVYCSEQYSVY